MLCRLPGNIKNIRHVIDNKYSLANLLLHWTKRNCSRLLQSLGRCTVSIQRPE